MTYILNSSKSMNARYWIRLLLVLPICKLYVRFALHIDLIWYLVYVLQIDCFDILSRSIYNLTHFNNQLIFGEFQTLKKIKNTHFVFVPHVEFISEFIIDLHFICNQSITFPRAQDLIVVCVWPFNEQIRYPNNEML